MVTRNPDMRVRSVELTAIGELQGAEHPSNITTTDRKKGILSTLHSNLPTRSTALWPCLPRSDFRSKTDQIEEASL